MDTPSSSPAKTVERPVEVRSWPERTDVMVLDAQRPHAIAIFPLQDNRLAPAWDPFAPYEARAADAIQRSESDQDMLASYYELTDGETVCLIPSLDRREKLDVLLNRYGLGLNEVEMPHLMELVRNFKSMPIDQLYAFLCDWHDVVEKDLPAGTSALKSESWVKRAAPEKRCHFHYLVTGIDDREAMTEQATESAYAEFLMLVDVEVEHFSLGSLIRWIYFHRTEFRGTGLPMLQAVKELQELRRS
jgi:hypothetical protein